MGIWTLESKCYTIDIITLKNNDQPNALHNVKTNTSNI